MAQVTTPLSEDTSTAHPVASGLPLQIGAATLARLVINTSRRFPYTFAVALSRGLGVPITGITSLIAINQATGILSPVFGPLGDRRGYRLMMLAGLGVLAFGMLAGGLVPLMRRSSSAGCRRSGESGSAVAAASGW